MHALKNSMLRNAHAEDSGPLCWATLQRFPCLPSFRALTIYIPRLSRLQNYPRRLQLACLRPRQQAPLQPTRATYFLLASDPSATFFADPSPSYSRFTFGRPLSTRHFPFLLEFDLYTAYFVEPPRAFFSSGDYSIALSDDFDTV